MGPAAATIARWRRDPARFVREVFHVEPDRWQLRVLALVGNPAIQRIAMKACKGPGKTAVEAWIIWWWMVVYPHPNVACTSISGDNLQDGLWKELAKWRHQSPFLQEAFDWQKTRLIAKESPATWWASARQWSKSADAQQQSLTLAGLHADYMLFVADESGGIPLPVMVTAEAALATGKRCLILQGGNPTHTDGPLWMACTQFAHLWSIVEVTGDPDDPDRSPRIPIAWARQQIEMFGRDNPWVLVNVFGMFPPASINAILGPDEVRTAMTTHLRIDQYNWAQKRLGIDVARFGDDRTVIFPRQGLAAFEPVILRGERTTTIAARVMLAKRRWDSEVELIDDTGHWGHGVIDNLLASGHDPIGVQFHGPALDKRYKNRRAEGWLEMAEWIRRGGALPNIPEMIGELTTPTYTFVGGQFMLEDKDQVKERLGRSPDLADALALTFMIPELPESRLARSRAGSVTEQRPGWGGASLEHDYDPLEHRI